MDGFEAVDRLIGGRPPPPPRTVWELVLAENAAYLVDDDVRAAVMDRLAAEIGLAPDAILATTVPELAQVIAAGGMRPEMRAVKLHECARQAVAAGGIHRLGDRRILQDFPGMGTAALDRVLTLAGQGDAVAVESNGLRVLQRIGAVGDSGNWDRDWKAARDRLAGRSAEWAAKAITVLREHGKGICRRTTPRCRVCVLAAECPSRRD